jgi:hypothetical protein
MKRILFFSALILAAAPALADGPIAVTLQNHKFTPAEIHVKANTPAIIALTNKDATAEEFESIPLRREKVIAGKSEGVVYVGPLSPGRYEFFGDFNPKTARGFLLVK